MTRVLSLEPDGPESMPVLERVSHDFYHLPAYVRAIAAHEGGRAMACLAQVGDASLFVPLIVREIPVELAGEPGWHDARSPYGYGAPLASGCSGELLEELLRAVVAHLRDQRIVSVFLRLHPLIGLPVQPLRAIGHLVEHGETVCVDLTKPEEQLRSELRADHRRRISRLERDGFRVCVDDWTLLRSFEEAYEETMKQVAADDYYFFRHELFEELGPLYGGCLHLLCVQDADDGVPCAGLYISDCGIAQNFLSATYTAYRSAAPSSILNLPVHQDVGPDGLRKLLCALSDWVHKLGW